MDIYAGDVKITPEGMTWHLGQPEMDAGLGTAVYLSLGTDDGWQGKGSGLGALEDSTLTNQVRLDYIELARAALQWLVDEGIATAVDIEAEIQGPGMLAVQITVTEPDGKATAYRYAATWRATEEAL